MKNNSTKILMIVNTVLLGLLMLVPGLMKAFGYGASGVSGMLSNMWMFSWAPMFWAWVLIVGEIGSGIAILARWKLKYVSIIPVIIIGVAILTSTINWSVMGKTNWTNLIFHAIALVNYLMLACGKR